MHVMKRYERVKKVRNQTLSAFVYKLYKLELNLFYAACYRPQVGISSESDLIISLTSFPARIKTVWLTIATLLSQSVKPKMIILWLSKTQFPNLYADIPKSLLKLQKYGLTIEFCDDDLKPHKKYYYTMKKYPKYRVITVDDDVFYPENLLESLDCLSKEYPNSVCCTWAHEMTIMDEKILPYKNWKHGVWGSTPSHRLVAVGCGGVLYPPHSVCAEVFNANAIRELCLHTDDLWLKCMELLHGTTVVRINEKPLIFFSQLGSVKTGLSLINVGFNRNDEALAKIVSRYPDVIKRLQ